MTRIHRCSDARSRCHRCRCSRFHPEPPDDPIGDALRADAVAYWKMDEASGSRADSTGRGNTLADVNSNVLGVAGKVGNAAQFNPANPVFNQKLRINSNADVSINPAGDYYLWTWAKLNKSLLGGSAITIFDKGLDSTGEHEYQIIYYDPSGKFSFNNFNGVGVEFDLAIDDLTWYFVEIIYNHALGDNGQMGIAINGAAFTMADLFEGGISVFAYGLYVGNDDDDNNVGAGWIDESGIMQRLPSTDEHAYLYNSGAGRTLYP